MPMQRPTCDRIRVRSPADAHVIFHGVATGLLPMITRRLDTEERRRIQSGCVFVWEERGGPNTEPMGLGIERWTDSIRWGPSRVRDEFLSYHERDPEPIDIDLGYDSDAPWVAFLQCLTPLPLPLLLTPLPVPSPVVRIRSSPLGYTPAAHIPWRENLIKQTYSVFVETTSGRRKWHLIAYFTQDTVDYLPTVEQHPHLAHVHVPAGVYKSARSANRSARTTARQPYNPNPHNAYPPPYLENLAENPYLGENPTALWAQAQQRIKEILAPLEYLEAIPPTRRHPEDEKALMSFVPVLT
ncbi:Gti1/Pac2 family-domain-containing protein [Mycena filopes]|nr:Gti1/Pac2 family-domain-containing protein [Mycena filopes]